jgi:hypothetical protein
MVGGSIYVGLLKGGAGGRDAGGRGVKGREEVAGAEYTCVPC